MHNDQIREAERKRMLLDHETVKRSNKTFKNKESVQLIIDGFKKEFRSKLQILQADEMMMSGQ